MEITAEWLQKRGACDSPVEKFKKKFPRGCELEYLVARLDRADWLIWLLSRTGTDHRTLVKLACICARRALRFVPPGEDRPKLAIEAAEAWAKNPTKENAARSATAVAGAVTAAKGDVGSAAWVAAEAAEATEATWAAGWVWRVASWAGKEEHKVLCGLIREHLKTKEKNNGKQWK